MYDNNAFQVGDRVWSMACGWGSVISIGRPPDTYRLQVRFDQSSDDDDLCAYYTTDGRLQRHEARTLFFAEIPVPPEVLVRPFRFERGEVVQWRDPQEGNGWHLGFYVRPDRTRHLVIYAGRVPFLVDVVRKPVMPEIDEVAQEASDEQLNGLKGD
jgi:hypothetical protein